MNRETHEIDSPDPFSEKIDVCNEVSERSAIDSTQFSGAHLYRQTLCLYKACATEQQPIFQGSRPQLSSVYKGNIDSPKQSVNSVWCGRQTDKLS